MRRRLRLPGVQDSECGVALIFVLLVLSLLLAVVGEFAQAMRLEGTTTLNFRNAVTTAHLAEAAYQRAAAEILPEAVDQELDERGFLVFRRTRVGTATAPPRLDLALGPGLISYRITDEESRINLNRATPQLLHRLLTEVGVERTARDVIVDSILDWRDPNEEHRLNGAESDYYTTLPVPYRSKNADFDSVDELLQVRGMTREILYGRPLSPGLAESLTVAGSGAINVNTVSVPVLRTLGFAQAEADLLAAGRPYRDLSTLSTQLRRGNQRTRSETFRIEAWGNLSVGQSARTLTAIVQRRAGRDGTVRVIPLSWRWSPDETPR
jgi:general secretion pathway protein K